MIPSLSDGSLSGGQWTTIGPRGSFKKNSLLELDHFYFSCLQVLLKFLVTSLLWVHNLLLHIDYQMQQLQQYLLTREENITFRGLGYYKSNSETRAYFQFSYLNPMCERNVGHFIYFSIRYITFHLVLYFNVIYVIPLSVSLLSIFVIIMVRSMRTESL